MFQEPYGFQKLVVWQNTYKLRILIYKITTRFPRNEYKRVAQMRDAARSVKQNIQEGYKRGSRQQYIQSLQIARGSLCELEGDIRDCFDDKLINEREFEILNSLSKKTDYLFRRLIESLINKK